jgi:hypothetical protein
VNFPSPARQTNKAVPKRGNVEHTEVYTIACRTFSRESSLSPQKYVSTLAPKAWPPVKDPRDNRKLKPNDDKWGAGRRSGEPTRGFGAPFRILELASPATFSRRPSLAGTGAADPRRPCGGGLSRGNSAPRCTMPEPLVEAQAFLTSNLNWRSDRDWSCPERNLTCSVSATTIPRPLHVSLGNHRTKDRAPSILVRRRARQGSQSKTVQALLP